jgi:phosphoglycerate dehydrogenase-like enzyme
LIPAKNELTIGFAHVAYQLGPQFAKRNTGIKFFHATSREELEARIGEADVLVLSGLWRNELVDLAPKLRFIQVCAAGTDQFNREILSKRGIRLASGSGVNARAVSDHAMSLMLALARKLPEARDNQAKKIWRGMISDINAREDELAGKTLFIVGTGKIGDRLARLAKAFEMQVVGFRRNTSAGKGHADALHSISEFKSMLPRADVVALCCPLTDDTRNLIDAEALSRMKSSAYLINVARGPCVNEAALVKALNDGQIAGAGIDVTAEEPLPASSALWTARNAFITPHTAGETRKYEDNVLDILQENLDRLWRGEPTLHNQIL